MFARQPAQRATRASAAHYHAPPKSIVVHVPPPDQNPQTFVPRCYGCGGKLHTSVQDGLLYCMDSRCVAGPRLASAVASEQESPPVQRHSIVRRPTPSPSASPKPPSPPPAASPRPPENNSSDSLPALEDDERAARILLHILSEGAPTPEVAAANSITRMAAAAPEKDDHRTPVYYVALLAPPVCPSCYSSAYASRNVGELQYRCTNKSKPGCAKVLF